MFIVTELVSLSIIHFSSKRKTSSYMDGWYSNVVLKPCCLYRISLLEIFFVVLDFSHTVNAVTLIYKSGRGLAISFTKQGKSGSI